MTGETTDVTSPERLAQLLSMGLRGHHSGGNPGDTETPAEVLEDMLDAGFRIIITGVYAEGLDESWLGLEIDPDVLQRLDILREKYGVSVTGEGGELETFVLDGPNFSKTVEVLDARKSWARDSGTYEITKASLVDL